MKIHGGQPCDICQSKRILLRADGSYIRCWTCREQCGEYHLGISGRWTKKRHEEIKVEAAGLV